MEEIRLGKYRHFKGGEYEVIGLARHSETLEPMVVYRALYGERGLWVRPAQMWKNLPALYLHRRGNAIAPHFNQLQLPVAELQAAVACPATEFFLLWGQQ